MFFLYFNNLLLYALFCYKSCYIIHVFALYFINSVVTYRLSFWQNNIHLDIVCIGHICQYYPFRSPCSFCFFWYIRLPHVSIIQIQQRQNGFFDLFETVVTPPDKGRVLFGWKWQCTRDIIFMCLMWEEPRSKFFVYIILKRAGPLLHVG